MPQPITHEEHTDYLISSIRLMLWFTCHWLTQHPEEDFGEVLNNRVDIYRRTAFSANELDFWSEGLLNDPHWVRAAEDLRAIYKTCADNAALFEQKAIDFLKPVILARVDRDMAEYALGQPPQGYQCGSLRYNPGPDKNRPERITFHIANARYPGSIFDARDYLPRCFVALMDQCESQFGVTEIGTGTWLNSHPRWLKLFPEQWLTHMGPPHENVQWHLGFWGQFMTARRTFNHRRASQFRATGVLPMPLRNSWCSISALRNHLQQYRVHG